MRCAIKATTRGIRVTHGMVYQDRTVAQARARLERLSPEQLAKREQSVALALSSGGTRLSTKSKAIEQGGLSHRSASLLRSALTL